jgi:hypothetical protein
VTQEVAKVGVGEKGRGYGGGIITTPVKEYFQSKDRISFEIQIPKAMQLFKAQYDRNPTDAEFWETIIKENAIPLPELPAGQTYVYDPKSGELMVQHPGAPQ